MKRINANKLIEDLKATFYNDLQQHEIDRIINYIIRWVKMETKDHKCIECGKKIKAGNHNELCSGMCEVFYA